MCEPTAILIGTKVASEAVSAVGEIGKVKEQRREAEQFKQATSDALEVALSDLRERGAEETLAAAESINQTRRTARAAAATARTAAGEAGVGGVSVDLLLGDVQRQAGERRESIRANRDAALRQLEREGRGARARAASQIAGVPDPPSFLSTGIRIGARALGTAGEFLIPRTPPGTGLTDLSTDPVSQAPRGLAPTLPGISIPPSRTSDPSGLIPVGG